MCCVYVYFISVRFCVRPQERITFYFFQFENGFRTVDLYNTQRTYILTSYCIALLQYIYVKYMMYNISCICKVLVCTAYSIKTYDQGKVS